MEAVVPGRAGPRQGDGAGSCSAQAPAGLWPCHTEASVIPACPEHLVSQPLGIHYPRLVRLLQGADTQPGSSPPFPPTVVHLFYPDSPLRGKAYIYGGLSAQLLWKADAPMELGVQEIGAGRVGGISWKG